MASQGFELAMKMTGLNKAAVMLKLWENANRAMQDVPVVDARGNPTGVYQYDGNTANRALELFLERA